MRNASPPKGALATHYRLKKGAVYGSDFERTGTVFLADAPKGKFYALLEVEPGTETDAGAQSIHVRRTDTLPLSVDDFLARLQRAEVQAAAATEKMQRWHERACPRCRGMVEEQAGVAMTVGEREPLEFHQEWEQKARAALKFQQEHEERKAAKKKARK